MRKIWLTISVIPIVFAAGTIAFFLLIPMELITLGNFIAYMASLSTVVMVLVYLLTTSQQLNAMQSQLTEMQLTRNLQTQPLPYPRITKSEIIAPNFWGFPQDEFGKMHLVYTLMFVGSIENLGNSPAVSVDIFPRVVCIETRGAKQSDIVCLQDLTPTKEEMLERDWQRIECLPLRDLGAKEISCAFPDDHALVESFLSQRISQQQLQLTILYKNILGAGFRTDLAYAIDYPETESEKLKLLLKAMESAKIDFAEDLVQYETCRASGRTEKAEELSSKLRKDFPAKYKLENIHLELELIPGSFSVKPITEKEYAEELAKEIETHKRGFPLVRVAKDKTLH